MNAASTKFAALVIRKVSELDWHPLHLMSNVSVSVGVVMNPAGPERGIGIISSAFLKELDGPRMGEGSRNAGLARLHGEELTRTGI